MLGLLPQDDTNGIAQVCRSSLPQFDGIRAHEGDERALVLQHRDLRYFGSTAIDPLEILGDHLLAASQHQDFLGAPGDEQETIPIEEPQITSAEPSVRSERRLIGLEIVEIAAGNRASTELDLADPLIIGVRDPNLAVGERATSATERAGVQTIAGEQRRGFGEPVSREHRPAESFQLRLGLPPEPCATRYQQSQLPRNAVPNSANRKRPRRIPLDC